MDKIYIHEVGPRDGLQVEKKLVPLEEKIPRMGLQEGIQLDTLLDVANRAGAFFLIASCLALS